MPDGSRRNLAGAVPSSGVTRSSARSEDAWRDGGAAQVVSAAAGVGKSRLVRELASWAQTKGGLVLTGRCSPTGQDTPLRPWREALLAAARAGRRPTADLDAFVPALARVVPEWGDAGADPSALVLGEAVVRLLSSWTAADTATLLVLEDLHWADPESLAVLEYVVDNLAGAPLLVVATLRDGEPGPGADLAAELIARRAALAVRLGPLSDDEVLAVARSCLDGGDLPDDAGAALVARCDGVPFLVEELLATAVRSGWDTITDGVPGSVAASVATRLDGLPPAARPLLTAAALLGRHFDWTLAAAAAGVTEDEAAELLRLAVRAQLLDVEGAGFRFRHAPDPRRGRGGRPPRRAGAPRPPRARRRSPPPPPSSTASSGPSPRGWPRWPARRTGPPTCGCAAPGGRSTRAPSPPPRAWPGTPATPARRVAGRRRRRGPAAGVRAVRPDGAGRRARPPPARRPDRPDRARRRPPRAGRGRARGRPLGRRRGARHRRPHADGVRPRPARPRRRPRRRRPPSAATTSTPPSPSPPPPSRGARKTGQVAVECEALEVIGRAERGRDVAKAEAAFTEAHDIAAAAGLRLWQVRALQELGTIDLFVSLAPDRLLEARRVAVSLGALATAAVIDLQLGALYDERGDLAESLAASTRCEEASRRWRLSTLPMSLAVQAAAHARLGDREAMERACEAAIATGEDQDYVVEAVQGNTLAVFHIVQGDLAAAARAVDVAMVVLRRNPDAAQPFPGLWALLRTLIDDDGDAAAPRGGRARASTRR